MIRSEVYDAVRAISDRPDMADSELDIIRGMWESELATALTEHPRNRKRLRYTFPTDDGAGGTPDATGDLPLPVDISQLIGVSNADGVLYRQAPNAKSGNQSDYTYIDYGTMLQVRPKVAAGGVVYIDYYGIPVPLSESVSINWVSQFFAAVYVYGMLKWLAIYTKDATNLPGWSGELERHLDSVRGQGWDQNFAAGGREVMV